jgi:thimet oligopeptidase
VLHSLLTTAELASQAGIAVKRDFVEAPSQIFENWVWNYESLKLFARHYKTGELLPKALFDKMLAAKNVGSGLAASLQLNYGILDMTLHDRYDPNGPKTTTEVAKEVYNQVLPFRFVEGTAYHAAFGHLLGYAAGYYGYMWSRVFADDMFSVFEQNGILDAKTGGRYRNLVLAPGSTREEHEMVKEFLGREPNQKAFFRSIGIHPAF